MKCAWSLDGENWTDFPVGPQFDLMLGADESNIDLETDGGVQWLARLFERDRWDLTFKCTMDQMSNFIDHHVAISGKLTPFYLTLDREADPIVSLYGRKESGYSFQGTGEKIQPPAFLYRMTIKKEIAAVAAYGITELWHAENAGFDSVTSTPIVVDPFMLSGVSQGPCVIYTSQDGSCYVRLVSDGSLAWSKAAGAACYGRAQAVILQGETDHSVFFPSHDGKIWAQNSDGSDRWTLANLYVREGGYGTSGLTPVAGSAGATFVQVSGKSWDVNAFIRSHSTPGNNASVRIISGTGSGVTLYEIKEVASADHSKLTFWSGIFPAVDGTSRIEVVPKNASDIYWQHAGTLVVEGGVDYLIACGYDGTVTKIRCTDGAVMAYFCALDSNEAWPLVADVGLGHVSVVFGSLDTNVRCLQLSDLTLEWAHTFPKAIAGALDSAPVDGTTLAILVNGRRSGDATAGRTSYLKATDGTLLFASGDMSDDMDTRPCPILQGDGTYVVAVVGDSGKPTLLDSIGAALWQKTRSVEFKSSPIVFDLDSDGFFEIIMCDMDGNMLIYNQSGVLFSILEAHAGVEGIPAVGDFLGNGKVQFLVPTISSGSLKGRMTCYEFSQG